MCQKQCKKLTLLLVSEFPAAGEELVGESTVLQCATFFVVSAVVMSAVGEADLVVGEESTTVADLAVGEESTMVAVAKSATFFVVSALVVVKSTEFFVVLAPVVVAESTEFFVVSVPVAVASVGGCCWSFCHWHFLGEVTCLTLFHG